MTQEEFVAFYPQFTGFTPGIVMTTYIAQANARFGSFVPEINIESDLNLRDTTRSWHNSIKMETTK